jgi:ABC-type transport system involved in multi-copper enzyme maturation permease subunit
MKFLAMLKDSLREAIDSKVFYVMVGLSVVLILLACTVTFTPKSGAENVMRAAALPLSVDLSALEDIGQDDDPSHVLERLRKNAQDVYHVTDVEAVNGEPNDPTATYLVKIQFVPIPSLFGRSKSVDADPAAKIREKFGRLGDWTVAEVLDVKAVHIEAGGLLDSFLRKRREFDVTVRPTPTALRLWPHSLSVFFGALPVLDQQKGFPLGTQVFLIEQVLVNSIGAWITILISIVITAFFVPNMLRKGTVDLLIVKPINRPVILLYKYLGGLLFIALNTTVAVAGVWLALGYRSGIWSTGFLASIPVIIFFFAILYSASTLFAVLTRSPIVSILLTCAVWFLLFIVGLTHSVFEGLRDLDRMTLPNRSSHYVSAVTLAADGPGAGALLAAAAMPPRMVDSIMEMRVYDWTFARMVAGLRYVLPRTSDLGTLTSRLSFKEMVFPVALNPREARVDSISWGESLTVSFAFIAVMLGLSCWRFSATDY